MSFLEIAKNLKEIKEIKQPNNTANEKYDDLLKNIDLSNTNQILDRHFKRGYKESVSDEIKSLIYHDYKNTNLMLGEIVKKYNVCQRTVLNVIKGLPKKGKRLTKIDENYFKAIDTSDKAYFLGFIIADGHIRDSESTKQCEITIHQQDKEILQIFKQCLNTDYPINDKISHNKKTNTYSQLCRINLTNTRFVDNLISQGVTHDKSKELKFATNLPDHLMCHYIRGLIDGDGSWDIVDQGRTLRFWFCSPVKNFIEDFQNYLISKLDLGRVKIITNPANTCYSFAYGGNQQALKMYNFIYNSGGPRLKRKHKRATLHLQHRGLIPITHEYDNDITPYHAEVLTEKDFEQWDY